MPPTPAYAPTPDDAECPPLPASAQASYSGASRVGVPVPPSGAYLRAARVALGWSREELRTALLTQRGLKISFYTVHAWERGHEPRASVWIHVCAVLGIHPLGCPAMYEPRPDAPFGPNQTREDLATDTLFRNVAAAAAK